MTAPKLYTTGVRQQERTGYAGAAAGRDVQPQHRQNGNDVSAGVPDSRWSPQGQGVGSSIMQPLPLASRYGGTAKPEQQQQQPAGSALHSSWIRRLIPSPPDVASRELGQDAAYVWRRPQSSPLGGGGPGSCQPPLLLAAAPRAHKKKDQDAGMGFRPVAVDGGGRRTTASGFGNGQYVFKGKAPQEREHQHHGRDRSDVVDVEKDEGDRSAPRKANLPSYPHPRQVVLDGRSRQQQEENHGAVPSARVNDSSGPMMTGFGSLRVLRKPASGDVKKVGGLNPKLKSTATGGGSQLEAEVPASQVDIRRLGTSDRRMTGTAFTTLPKTASLSDLQKASEVGRPRLVEYAGAQSFLTAKKNEIGEDSGRPGILQPDTGAREASHPRVLEGGAPTGKLMPFFDSLQAPWFENFAGKGSGFERPNPNFDNVRARPSPTYSPAPLERKQDTRMNDSQGAPSWSRGRAGFEAFNGIDKPSCGTGGYVPKGFETKKMKEIKGSGFVSRGHGGAGPSQQNHSNGIPRFAPHHFQGDTSIGKIGLPLPFSPHSSFPSDEVPGDAREDARNSRGRPEPSTRLLAPFFAGSRPQQGPAPWTSLFAAYKGQNNLDPPNSTSTPTLPPDVHSRLRDGPLSANPSFEGPMASGNHEDNSGDHGRDDTYLPASSADARGPFDNQSSHFSNCPWPDNPNDDGVSGPYNSKASVSGPYTSKVTASGYHSQASQTQSRQIQVLTRTANNFRGQHDGKYKYSAGCMKEVSVTPARSRDLSVSDALDLKKSPDSLGKGARGKDILIEENQAGGSTRPLKYLVVQPGSEGQNDDTSGSSPPSQPLANNSNFSDMCSPALPRVAGNEQLIRREVETSTWQVESEREGSPFTRRQQGHVNNLASRWQTGNADLQEQDNGVSEDHRSVGIPHNDLDASMSQHMAGSVHCMVSNRGGRTDTGEAGHKHGKLRTSGEAMDEAGTSGPSKRSRYYPNSDPRGLISSADGAETRKPSSWLKRWLPPMNDTVTKAPSPLARAKDNTWISDSAKGSGRPREGFDVGMSEDRRHQGRKGEPANRKKIEENGFRVRTDLTTKRGMNTLPSLPLPSAAAYALAGTAARKMGPLHQERKGSLAMWPSVHLQQTPQVPDAQRSVQSSDLPVRADHG